MQKEIASASFSSGNGGGGRILYLGVKILARITPLHLGLPPWVLSSVFMVHMPLYTGDIRKDCSSELQPTHPTATRRVHVHCPLRSFRVVTGSTGNRSRGQN